MYITGERTPVAHRAENPKAPTQSRLWVTRMMLRRGTRSASGPAHRLVSTVISIWVMVTSPTQAPRSVIWSIT